ncbi:MAG: hypothetical protein ACYCY0_10025 [Acidithiobacillus ferrivorans]
MRPARYLLNTLAQQTRQIYAYILLLNSQVCRPAALGVRLVQSALNWSCENGDFIRYSVMEEVDMTFGVEVARMLILAMVGAAGVITVSFLIGAVGWLFVKSIP